VALKALLDNLDGIEEGDKKHYVEKDGKFVLQVEDFGKHPGAVTLKGTADKLDKDKKAAEKRATEAETKLIGIPEDFDAEEWARLKSLPDDAKDPEAKKKFDDQLQSQKAILEQKNAAALKAKDVEIADRDAKLAEANGFIDKTLAENGLRTSLLENGVMPELVDGALASLRPSVKVVKNDAGERKAIVETDLGEVAIPDFVKDWSGTKGKAYLGKASGPDVKGNHRPGQTFTGKTMKRADFDRLDPASQMKAINVDQVQVVDA
jgi:hypothetical protein